VSNLHTLIRDLQRRKARERRDLVVAEGRRLVADALASGVPVRAVLAAEDAATGPAAPLLADATARGIPTEVTDRQAFDALADTETPSGVLAVVEWAPATLAGLSLEPGRAVVLVLDAVQDPGNVGTMVRTAFALGARLTVALDGSADLRNPKVLRAAMGAPFRYPVAQAHADECLAFLEANGVALWVATMDGAPVVPGTQVPPRLALAVGNEGGGIRPELLARADLRAAVAMRPEAESLNAAVAAGILLHQVTDAAR
jgi:TrmH family RNA methyltransferase